MLRPNERNSETESTAKQPELPTIVSLFKQQGYISAETAEKIRTSQPDNHHELMQTVISETGHTDVEIAKIISELLGYPLLSLNELNWDAIPNDIFQQDVMIEYNCIPLKERGRTLYVAMSDPTNFAAIKEIRFRTGLTPEPIVVPHSHIRSLFASESDSLSLPGDVNHEFDFELDEDEVEGYDETNTDLNSADEDDAPIIRFVNKVLHDAIKIGASDIHFESYHKQFRIRYRVDGVLHIAHEPPHVLGSRIIARIKILAKLDISERRKPQDGKIKLKMGQSAIDFRVNTTPTIHGEKVVLRILDSSAAKLDIDILGLDESQKALLMKKIHMPQGMVLVTGPTGSGKTVTIYTSLRILNQPDINISTAEDPVEIQLPGINQVHINNKVGLDFASALRAFLRQDPDVIMIGEIRDYETAEVAVKAAQTGHLLLSTLHTNSSAETLVRLRNIGIEHYNISSTVELIVAQRLGRKLCNKCKTPIEKDVALLLSVGMSESEIHDESWVQYAPVGCNSCTKGYRGRIGFYEFMDITAEIEKMITQEAGAPDIEAQAIKDGMTTLRQSAINSMKAGITSLEEVQRVTV